MHHQVVQFCNNGSVGNTWRAAYGQATSSLPCTQLADVCRMPVSPHVPIAATAAVLPLLDMTIVQPTPSPKTSLPPAQQ